MPEHLVMLGVVEAGVVPALQHQVQRRLHRAPAPRVDLRLQLPGRPRRVLEEEAEVLRHRLAGLDERIYLVAAAVKDAVRHLGGVFEPVNTVDHVHTLAHIAAKVKRIRLEVG